MPLPTLPPAWLEHPALACLDPQVRERVLAEEAQLLEVPAGAVLFDEGSPCTGFPLLLAGEVRVARGSPQGRSLELYRVGPGEVCIASLACLERGRPLFAHAVCTQPASLLLLRRAGFERWLEQPGFRRALLAVMAERLAELMQLVEAVAFQRLDQRLAAALLGRGEVLACTHQALADEVGTVREIVTRLLHRFEQQGWVVLGRERITVRDAAALRRHAAG